MQGQPSNRDRWIPSFADGRPGLLPALLLWLLTASVGAMDRQQFAERLAHAEQLNIEAPWPESQAVLDELRPHLDVASESQFVTFMMLTSRNQALDGRIEESLATVERLLERDLDPEQRVAAHSRAANVGHIARQFETTYRHLNAALALLEHPELDHFGSEVYSIAAYMYTLVEQYEDALSFGRKAVATARAHGMIREQCAAHQRLAFVHKRRDAFEAAREHYLDALEACPQAGEALIAGVVEYGLADLLQARGHYDEARVRFARGIAAMEEQGYRSGLAEARVYRARMARAEGDDALAERILEAALPDLHSAGHTEYAAEAHRSLAEIHRERGRLDAAFDHLLESMAAREAYLGEVRARQSAFLQMEFAVADTERELGQLREQQRIAELERQSRTQRSLLRAVIAVAAGVLLVLLLILWIRAVRDRRRFRRLSQRDALTALSNHTRFFELAERTLDLSREKHQPFTLLLGDIDHFKQVNDRYGHLVGDQVLKRVADRLRDHLGRIGIVGRVGGEEFGVAVPGVNREEIQRRLELLRRELASVSVDGRTVPITVSFGLASPGSDESLTELRKRVDDRLYAAKAAGRDRVVGDDPTP